VVRSGVGTSGMFQVSFQPLFRFDRLPAVMNIKPVPIRAVLAASLAVISMSLVGCGSSDDPSAESRSSTASGTDGSAADSTSDLRQCLADKGIEIPSGGIAAPQGSEAAPGGLPSLPEGVNPAELQQAFSECGGQLPAGGGLPGFGSSELAAFRTCLADNGVKVASDATVAELPVDDPAFQAASQTCAPLLPASGGIPGVASTTIAQ
jgi:hypothetical protein